MVEKKDELRHKVIMENRKLMVISGVKKVKSFEPKEIVLETSKGGLIIKGHDLVIKNLDLEKSEVEIEGNIDILTYSAGKESGAKGRWERIFK